MKKTWTIMFVLIAVFAASCCPDYSWGMYPPSLFITEYDVTYNYTDTYSTTITVEKNEEITIPDNTFTQTGAIFGWWEDQKGNQYNPGDVIKIKSDMVFTSEWIKDKAPVTVGDTEYSSVADAVTKADDGASIVIPDNTTTDGLKFPDGKYGTDGIDFDLNGNSMYIVSTVGSSGTETNGMQLLKGNKVSFKDGVITSDSETCKILLQNYADLTLSNVTLAPGPKTQELLGINNGIVILSNGTTLLPITEVASSSFITDIYYWPDNGYTGEVGLIIETPDVEINGTLLISRDKTDYAEKNFEENIIVIVPDSYVNTIENIIDFQIPGYSYDWEDCEREGYKEGYKQMIFIAE